jgi:uncharacterized membrane protein SpoIIM required for sporulation
MHPVAIVIYLLSLGIKVVNIRTIYLNFCNIGFLVAHCVYMHGWHDSQNKQQLLS